LLPITHPFHANSERLKQARERFEERRVVFYIFCTLNDTYVHILILKLCLLLIYSYLNKHGISNSPKALALEIYHFANPKFPEEVDVYIPTHE